MNIRNYNALPGLNICLGLTIFYLSIVVLLPFIALIVMSTKLGISEFFSVLTDERVLNSFRLTFYTSFAAALINAVFGTLIAWFLVRVPFPGKKIIDSLIDLPFALPTAVSGIALTTIYSKNGFLGKPLLEAGIKVAFTPAGIILAMVLIGIPFVVRSVQPALEDLDGELEEAASSLGAGNFKIFTKVIFPVITPSILTGFALAFARSLGEYGSVIFIAGNMPMKTEISSLLIVTKLEQYDTVGATIIGAGMLIISFILLFIINRLQSLSGRYLTGR